MRYYPYNTTFDIYTEPYEQRSKAKMFVQEHNQCKGGVWTIHNEKQYQEWLEKREGYPRFDKIKTLTIPHIKVPFPDMRSVFSEPSYVVSPADKVGK